MSALLKSNTLEYHHHHHHDESKTMTISYADHSSSYSSYGLITPPSEMRSNIELGNNNAAQLPDPNNILAPPSNGRYFLRKQPSLPTPTYPNNNNNNYQHNNHNSYLHPRRRSVSSNSTTASSTTSSSILRPVSPPLDIESRDFNVGEFTATVYSLFCVVCTNKSRWSAFSGLSRFLFSIMLALHLNILN